MDTEIDAMADITNELDDLGNLFEFGDIDLNNIPDVGEGQFGEGAAQQPQHHMPAAHSSHPQSPFHELGEPPQIPIGTPHEFNGSEPFGSLPNQDRTHQPHYGHSGSAPAPYNADAMYQPSVQHVYHPNQYAYNHAHGFPPGHHVPPTPTSLEMHGEVGRFLQQHGQLDPQQRAILEQRYHIRKDDAIAFTPMASPAGTPQFPVLPEFTTPGAYFSPLTSPMIHAQNAQQAHLQHQGYLTNSSTAPSSNATSPVDPIVDIEMLGTPVPDSSRPAERKSRRKLATPRAASAAARVRQSPIQKPQKRKSGMLSSASQNAMEAHLQRAVTSAPSLPNSAGLHAPPAFDSSEAESVSPEPLSESVMGPPPRPGSSLNQSPTLVGQLHQQQDLHSTAIGAAATPKSLLTMRNNQPANSHPATAHVPRTAGEPGGLDDLSLPEAATKPDSHRPQLAQINTHVSGGGSNELTPRLGARKTPKLGPQSTPSSATRPSAPLPSPTAVSTPLNASTPSAILRDRRDSKGGRANKKRGDVSANGSKLLSPALVPKISPSIKPLLPEGTPLNSATQAMLLASKSNYQNLLEGNRLPGVNYPDSLSTGLTSKRTSHKVAEQGRRNRINEALKEMQALIPSSPAAKPASSSASAKDSPPVDGGAGDGGSTGDGGEDDLLPPPSASTDKASAKLDSKEAKEDASAKSNSSKAATVELANEYIRRMQKDSALQSESILQLRRENEELRKRLALQGAGSVSGSGSGSASGSSDAGEGAGMRESPEAKLESPAPAAAAPAVVKVQ